MGSNGEGTLVSTLTEDPLPSSAERPPSARDPRQISTAVAAQARTHWTWLLICSAVILLSFVFRVQGQEQVVVGGLGVALPPLCAFKRLLGWDCPGCGMTRCFISMAQGDIVRAWDFNPGGVYFYGLVLAQIPFRTWQLVRLRRGQLPVDLGKWGMIPLLTLVFLLIGQWLVRMADLWLA